jgi:murein DD-endopeptidase MepM/ murein hydrolase activator NlpD
MPNKESIKFWPINENNDGVRRYWDWLRRWLLANVRTRAAVILSLFILVTVLVTQANWLFLIKEFPQRQQPMLSMDVGRINLLQAENTPTEVFTRRFTNTVSEEVFEPQAQVTPYTQVYPATPATPATPVNPVTPATPVTNQAWPDHLPKPMEGEIATPYGLAFSAIYQDYRFHDGIDIISTKDDQVKAVLDGTVVNISKDELVGQVVTIKHAQNYRTIYGQIRNPQVTIGQQVKQGQFLGKVVAEQGILHFAIKKGQQGLNPLQYLSY